MTPAPPTWVGHWVYDVVTVTDLPIPNEIREPRCMIGAKRWLQRRARRLGLAWLVARQHPRDCCWHHQVDWHQAAEAAIRLVRQAQAAGLASKGIGDYVIDRLGDEGLGDDENHAVISLVAAGGGIQLHDDPRMRYYEGQHRVAAQLDQAVPETVVQRLELIDSASGQQQPDEL